MDEIDNLLARPDEFPGLGHNRPPLAEVLREDHAAALTRAAYLLHGDGSYKRGFDGFPESVSTEEMADLAPAFAKQLVAQAKVLEDAHAAAKKPWLEACRTVDNVFLGLVRELREAARVVNRRLLAWHQAQTSPAAIIRSSYGPSASVRRTIGWKVVDEARIPRRFLKANPVAVEAHIKLAGGELPKPIPGIEFFHEQTMVSR